MNKKIKLAIIGLGYVGLPLCLEFGKNRKVIGFDLNKKRIENLKKNIDDNKEFNKLSIRYSKKTFFTSRVEDLNEANCFIIAVPTPVTKNLKPDLSYLVSASKIVGRLLKKNDIVIYESTVYPGATEEICVPILEEQSGLLFNNDFFCGYSPERINPGDKDHRITTIRKVTSGSTPEIAKKIDKLYQEIITEGTYMANSIKVAEAAKVIENTQRDVNIALINELSLIFNKLDIDTESVLEAAGTKWNFLPFRPGLVGGHCIGVDPYYLTHKALEVGYNPEMILAGRRINDNMSFFIADQVSKLMTKKDININGSNILLMGLAFKENCPDIRNTKVVDLIKELNNFDCSIDVYDPWVDKLEAMHEYNIELINAPAKGKYDAIVIAVAHDRFKDYSPNDIKDFGKDNNVIYDIKYLLSAEHVDGRL